MPTMLKLLLFNFNVADFIDSVPVAMPLFLLTLAEVDNLSDRVSADMQLFLNLLNADGNQPLLSYGQIGRFVGLYVLMSI